MHEHGLSCGRSADGDDPTVRGAHRGGRRGRLGPIQAIWKVARSSSATATNSALQPFRGAVQPLNAIALFEAAAIWRGLDIARKVLAQGHWEIVLDNKLQVP